MSRVLYIGGFGNGQASAEKVAEALTRSHFEDADTLTFSKAYAHPEVVERIAQDIEVVTHSAGMMAVRSALPKKIHAFNAPLPTTRRQYIARTIRKSNHMHKRGRGIQTEDDLAAVRHYERSSAGEFLAHPLGNLWPFLKGEISRFDAVDAAVKKQQSGVPITLGYTDHDDYFTLHRHNELYLGDADIAVAHLPGEHDELVLRPSQLLAAYFHSAAA